MSEKLEKNDIIELNIEDIGTGGEGIGKYDGMTFFVKDALIGDSIRARITKLKKNYGYARVEEILEPSGGRVEPACPDHRRCGGCQIQAMSYEKQLEFKFNKVKNNLIRLGGFSEEFCEKVMEPVVGMEEPFRYRNKAQFPIGMDKDGNPVAGFFAARTHSIIPVDDCMLGVEENKKILNIILDFMKEYKIQGYNEETGKGLVRHVLIRTGFDSKEIMVCLILNCKKLPNEDVLCQRLAEIPGMKSISININTEKTNVILGKETHCIWGESYITDTLYLRDCREEEKGVFPRTDSRVKYQISPQSFYQVNPNQTEKLYSLALDYAGLNQADGQKKNVWDLYCGIGTISLFMAQKAGKVYGVEIIPQAIEDAKNNAKLNGLDNAEFFVGKAEEVLTDFYNKGRGKNNGAAETEESAMLHPDVIMVDPPRKGCDEECLNTILKMAPEKVVYVSCDSATLARDLRILVDGGYELKKVRPVDQFGHTVHVETVVCLSNKNAKPKDYVEIGLDAEEYYRIKDSKRK